MRKGTIFHGISMNPNISVITTLLHIIDDVRAKVHDAQLKQVKPQAVVANAIEAPFSAV